MNTESGIAHVGSHHEARIAALVVDIASPLGGSLPRIYIDLGHR